MSRQIKGIDASPGIAIGKVFLYHEKELVIEFNDHSQDVDLDEVYQKIVK